MLKSSKIYDVIVVGAGPGGAVLAYLLARRGLDVLILEKALLPRYKTCGGGVTWKALQNLPFDISPVLEHKAIGGIVTYAGEHLMRVEVGWPVAWLVMRDRFDHFLVQQAVGAGAHLLEGVGVIGIEEQAETVIAHTSQGDFRGRLLAGADGVNSVVARSVGLLAEREVGVAIEAEVAVPAAALDIQGAYATFDFGTLAKGYGWIFPKQDHLSVGLFQARAGKAVGLRPALERFIASQAVLHTPQILHLQGHQIPLGGKRHILHKGRVLLVGDAANLADPWLGEGIYAAVVSARLASEVMVQALQVGEIDLSEYTNRVNAMLTPQFLYARLFAGIVYLIPDVCSVLLSRSPWMQEAVFSAMRGNLKIKDMTGMLLRGMPRILLEALVGSQAPLAASDG